MFLNNSNRPQKLYITFFGVVIVVIAVSCAHPEANCVDSFNCNGNGICLNNTCVCFNAWQGSQCQICDEKEGNLKIGSDCKSCTSGYWRNPDNGGQCEPCQCNGHGSECHQTTGKCYCDTKGSSGNHCEECDINNRYFSDPDKRLCYHELTTDYVFTFNLSKPEDKHYTKINFKNSPCKPNLDVDFQIICSKMAKFNITLVTADSEIGKTVYSNCDCSNFETKFLSSQYQFGIKPNGKPMTAFYVQVYDFQTPLWVKVSFAQYLK